MCLFYTCMHSGHVLYNAYQNEESPRLHVCQVLFISTYGLSLHHGCSVQLQQTWNKRISEKVVVSNTVSVIPVLSC